MQLVWDESVDWLRDVTLYKVLYSTFKKGISQMCVWFLHVSDFTLLFWQWIIFKNLVYSFILVYIWTLTFHYLGLKTRLDLSHLPAHKPPSVHHDLQKNSFNIFTHIIT